MNNQKSEYQQFFEAAERLKIACLNALKIPQIAEFLNSLILKFK